MRKVCISTGCMSSPTQGGDYLPVFKFDKVIDMCSKLNIDGVEILFGDARRLFNAKIMKKTVNQLKDLPFNTFHFPFKIGKERVYLRNDNVTKKILKKMYQICDKADVQSINIHPQQLKNRRVLNKDYNYTVENMEQHHGFTNNDYKQLMKKTGWKFVFDTTHAGEMGKIDNIFKAFKKDILYAHLSSNYYNHLHIPLHVLNPKYLTPLSVLKKSKFPLVIESQIGSKDIKEYKEEVNFIRKWAK